MPGDISTILRTALYHLLKYYLLVSSLFWAQQKQFESKYDKQENSLPAEQNSKHGISVDIVNEICWKPLLHG